MKKNIIIFLGLLCSIFTIAQNTQQENLDNLFNQFEKENKAMGSISIAENGIIVYQRSIGYANLVTKTKADEFTKYRIGSITKTYTATIILQLIEERKLNLNTLLKDYFPKIVNANKITIEHLLYHRSGLVNITSEDGFETWISKPRNRNEVLTKIIKNEIDFEPDTKKEYSNTNYILLSYIAEDIDEKSFSEIIKSRITKPLNLTRTQFGEEIKSAENEAFSYYWEDSKWNAITLETNLLGTMGAGAIVSTSKEVALFYDNLFSAKLITEASLGKMTTVKDEMGMGISVLNFKGLTIYGHDGGIDGFRSIAAYIPEKNLAVSFTFNASNGSSTNTLIQILETYFENDDTLQSKSLIELTSKDLDIYLGTYSGTTFPAKVTFTKKENILFAKATGQPIFKLIAVKKDVFKYDAMGINFHFNPQDKIMILGLGEKEHVLKKE